MVVERLHHVAYRCTDAKETVDFYERFLDLKLATSIAENVVPSTGERYPHCLLYTSPSPRDGLLSRMPSSA